MATTGSETPTPAGPADGQVAAAPSTSPAQQTNNGLGLFQTPPSAREGDSPAPAPAEGQLAGGDSLTRPAQQPGGGADPLPPGGVPADGGPLLSSILQSDELKTHASLTRYQSPDQLASAYVELEKKIGEKGVLVPGAEATAEERQAFYKQLPGYPESPQAYGLTPEVLAGVLPDGALAPAGEALDGLAQKAHDAGITAPQLGAVLTWYAEWMSGAVEGQTQATQQQAVSMNDELRKVWGANTDRNLLVAKEELRRTFGDNPAFLSQMISGGENGEPIQLGTSPEFAQILYELAGYKGTDQFIQFGASGLVTPTQAQTKIDEAREANKRGEMTNQALTQIIEQNQPLASERR